MTIKRMLFDATILRFGLQPGSARSGIFVVARELLLEFLRRGLSVDLTAEIHACADVQAYLDTQDEFRGLRMITLEGDPGAANFTSVISGYKTVGSREDGILVRAFRFVFKMNCKVLLLVAAAITKLKRMIHRPDLREKYDIFFSPMYLPEERVRRSGVPRYTVIYDTIPQILPELYEGNQGVGWTQELIDGLDENDRCFAISECTKRDFLKFAKKLKDENVTVVPLAASERRFFRCQDASQIRRVLRKYGLAPETRYFLSICTLDPRKNLPRALTAFSEFAKKDRTTLFLLVGGGRGVDPKIDEVLAAFEASIRQRVVLVGYVPDEDLAPLYSGAMAFVYLSLYEGFGLPPLEAMQCGCPVLTSGTSSLPEVVGDAALTVSPTDVPEIAKAMSEIAGNEALRSELQERGHRRSEMYTWKRTVDVMLSAINQYG